MTAVPHYHNLYRGCSHIQGDCRGQHIQSAKTSLTLENHLYSFLPPSLHPFSFLPPCSPLPGGCVLQVPREYEGGCWILWGCHWVWVLGTDLQSFAEQQASAPRSCHLTLSCDGARNGT